MLKHVVPALHYTSNCSNSVLTFVFCFCNSLLSLKGVVISYACITLLCALSASGLYNEVCKPTYGCYATV